MRIRKAIAIASMSVAIAGAAAPAVASEAQITPTSGVVTVFYHG